MLNSDSDVVAQLVTSRGFTRSSNTLTQLQVNHLLGWFAVLFQKINIKRVTIKVDFEAHSIEYVIVLIKKLKGKLNISPDRVKQLAEWVRWLLGNDWTVKCAGVTVDGTPHSVVPSSEVRNVIAGLQNYQNSNE